MKEGVLAEEGLGIRQSQYGIGRELGRGGSAVKEHRARGNFELLVTFLMKPSSAQTTTTSVCSLFEGEMKPKNFLAERSM